MDTLVLMENQELEEMLDLKEDQEVMDHQAQTAIPDQRETKDLVE